MKKPIGGFHPGPEVIKLFFMLGSAETKIYLAHKCWHFNIYEQDKLLALMV